MKGRKIKMIIDLDELNIKNHIDINYDVLYEEGIDKRIKGLEKAKVTGEITKNSNGDIELNCLFTGDMLIEDAITLDLVPYEFSINIEEDLEEIAESNTDVYEKMQNTLDLKAILWQNIVLEVPISYTKEKDAHLKGDGWELKNDNVKSSSIDPRLKKLEDLLKGDD